MKHQEHSMRNLFAMAALVAGLMAIGDVNPVMAKLIMAAPAEAAGVGGTVQFPCTQTDNSGNVFYFYDNGMFYMQGNMPVYSQSAQLNVNGNGLPSRGNAMGKVDEKTGEMILENLQVGNVTVTRRILVNKAESYIRYIDIYKSTTNQETQLNAQYISNMNYGVQSSVNVEDPKKKGQNLAWVAQSQSINRTAVEMFGGKGAKWVPTIQYNPGNSQVTFQANTTIPAGKEIAILHFHVLPSSTDAGKKFVLEMKESKILSTIPANIRRLIVNFAGGQSYIGDVEILRGEALDVIELKGGDVMKGTIQETSYKFQTFYGPVELKADNVIGIINTVDIKPRQLLVTPSGEIFGGTMDSSKITLRLSSGQVTDVPLSQISRVGYRKRDNEPEEWTFDKGLTLLRTGERIVVEPPALALNVTTRYGALKLPPEMINYIVFQSEEHGVHEIHLADGSVLSGLVGEEAFEMKLPNQSVKFPASSIVRLQYNKPKEDLDPNLPTLTMASGDLMVGLIEGKLKLDTAFNTLDIQGSEIKKMSKLANSPSGVQVVLWDDTSISGLLQETALPMKLSCGLTVKAPVAMLMGYSQPRPAPSANVMENIRKLVNELNSDDWKARDRAQEELTQMGVVTLTVLKELRPSAAPEAQQRIDQIIKEVEKNAATEKPTSSPQAPSPLPSPAQLLLD
jgi:hypothetical protein